MIYPVDRYINALIELNINPEQALFLQLIHERRHDLIYKYSIEGRYFQQKELGDLEEKGLVVNTNPDSRSEFADLYETTDLFGKAFYKTSDGDGLEFWNIYPAYITINNKKIPAKGINKEAFIRKYTRNTGLLYDHDRVLKALNYAKANKLINIRIDKWIESEAFVDIWALIEELPKIGLPHEQIF